MKSLIKKEAHRNVGFFNIKVNRFGNHKNNL